MKKLFTAIASLTLLSTGVFAYDCTNTGISGVPQDQCEAVVRLYNELNGPNREASYSSRLSEWSALETRYGIVVNGWNLYQINISDTNISGTISSWEWLSTLYSLWLIHPEASTGFPYSGEIVLPSTRSGLNNLWTLELQYNIDTLPTSRFWLESVTYLRLHYNNISSLPTSREWLNSTEYLWLSDNSIQSIPNSWTGLVNIDEIYLNNNAISNIPTSRAGLENSDEYLYLVLWSNLIRWTIPTTNIENISWAYLHLPNNKLHWEISNQLTKVIWDIENNYLITWNLETTLVEHLNANFWNRTNQQKAMTMYSPTLGYFNTIESLLPNTYTDISIDCDSTTRTNATTIAGGYDWYVNMFCWENTSSQPEISLMIF